MKIFLCIIAAVLFISPFLGWAYLVSLANAFNTSSANRGINLADYWDMEFLILATVPWLICAVILFFALRMS